MKTITLRFNQEDGDLEEYFNALERGQKSEQAKKLIRLGLAVKGINILQQLIERGIVDPLQVAVADTRPKKFASQSDEEMFIKNMAGSWD
jgi:UDP-N-acetylmuramoylalanine-D-glutamate ligase